MFSFAEKIKELLTEQKEIEDLVSGKIERIPIFEDENLGPETGDKKKSGGDGGEE